MKLFQDSCKSMFIGLILLWICSSVQALYTDTFLLGTYEIKNYSMLDSTNTKLLSRLKEAHYNCVKSENMEHYFIYKKDFTFPFTRLLKQLQANGLTAIVNDTYYPSYPLNATSEVGIEFLTSSNYFRFEAEYAQANSEVNAGDLNSDLYFYRFSRESGSIDDSSAAESNCHAWHCEADPVNNDHSWKVISGDLVRRWDTANDNERIEWVFRFPINADVETYRRYLVNNRLYISIAMRWENVPNNEDSLLSIEFQGMTVPHIGKDKKKIPEMMKILNFKPEGKYTNHLKVSDINYGASDNMLAPGYRVFTYSIRLDSLRTPDPYDLEQTLLSGGNALRYVVPFISWKQNLPVSIDYMEYEDTIHRMLQAKTKPDNLDAWMKRRIQTLNYSYKNITCYWGIDEPYPGNYDSCRKINEYLLSLDFGAKHPLVTNINHWVRMQKANGEEFSNFKLFNHYAKPLIVSIDPYPLDNTTLFNGVPTTDERFIQNKIDSAFKDYAEVKQTGVPFYTITQSYGDWDNVNRKFNGKIYPPPATQKCLQYLPLCFGTSGISNFATKHGNSHLITTLNANFSPNANFYAIKAANDKINTYGPIILKAQWLGSDCLLSSETAHPDLFEDTYATFRIPPREKRCCYSKPMEEYAGYIQCGYYQTETDKYYMFVNRRAEYIKAGNSSANTPLHKYKTVYRLASPQKVSIRLQDNDKALSVYGPALGLYDPYSRDLQCFQDGKVQIELQPGEASLRQYVESVPDIVSSSVTIKHFGVFKGNATINIFAGGVVTIAPGASVKLLKNCKVIINNGGKLVIQGNAEYEKGARIIVKQGGILEKK